MDGMSFGSSRDRRRPRQATFDLDAGLISDPRLLLLSASSKGETINVVAVRHVHSENLFTLSVSKPSQTRQPAAQRKVAASSAAFSGARSEGKLGIGR